MTEPPPTRFDDLAARLQVLEDKDAIWGLFMEYKRHLDARDFKAYATLFTDDAVWVGNLGKATGPAEIEDLLVRTMEVYESDRERTHHLVMNPVIEVHGDTATALSNWGYVTRSDTDAPGVRDARPLRRRAASARPRAGGSSGREAYSDVPYISLEGIL